MKPQDIAEIAIVAAVAIGCAPFLGAYMARVFSGAKHPLRFLEPVETLFYRITGIDSAEEMGWKKYLFRSRRSSFCMPTGISAAS